MEPLNEKTMKMLRGSRWPLQLLLQMMLLAESCLVSMYNKHSIILNLNHSLLFHLILKGVFFFLRVCV